MKKHLVLKKGKTALDFGPVDTIFPDGFLNFNIEDPGNLYDTIQMLVEDITNDERKIMILGAYTPANVADLETATTELSLSLSRMELNIHRKECMVLISGLMEFGFRPIVVEEDEKNEAEDTKEGETKDRETDRGSDKRKHQSSERAEEEQGKA